MINKVQKPSNPNSWSGFKKLHEKLKQNLTSSSFPDSIASNHLSSSLDVPLSLPLPFFLFDSVLGEDPTCPDLSSTLAGEPLSFVLSLELDGPALENTIHLVLAYDITLLYILELYMNNYTVQWTISVHS